MEIWKILAVLAIIGVVIGAAKAYTSTDTITAQVTVPSICVVSLSTNSIDFGTVNAGADTGSANQQVNITNTGNTQATSTTIKGTDWSDGGVNSFAVGNTEWSTSAFTYGSGTDLTTTDATIPGGNLNPGSSLTLYFGVGVPSGQAAATYTQTITITMNC